MSRRSFIKTVIGLGFLPIAVKAKVINNVQPATDILLQQSAIAGFQYYQAENIFTQMNIGDSLTLQAEPQNKYDHNAIAVYWKNSKLGYIPRRENKTLIQMLQRGQKLTAEIKHLQNSASVWERISVNVFLKQQLMSI